MLAVLARTLPRITSAGGMHMSYLEPALAWKAAHLSAELVEQRIYRAALGGPPVSSTDRAKALQLRRDAQEKLRVMLASYASAARQLRVPG